MWTMRTMRMTLKRKKFSQLGSTAWLFSDASQNGFSARHKVLSSARDTFKKKA